MNWADKHARILKLIDRTFQAAQAQFRAAMKAFDSGDQKEGVRIIARFEALNGREKKLWDAIERCYPKQFAYEWEMLKTKG